MADNIFQASGPPVSVSLYGDAAQVGAKLGQEIPNPVTSILKGAVAGYQTGQEIQATDQQNQIRQNQIDQLPLANQRAELELKQQQIQNERNQLKLEQETQNKDLETTTDAAKLQEQEGTSQYNTGVINKAKDLTANFANYSPYQKEQALFNGQYDDVYAKYPQLFKQFAISAMPELPKAKQDSLRYFFDKKGIIDKNQAAAQKNYPQYTATQEKLFYNNDLTGQLVGNSGLSAEQIYNNPDTRFAPQGSYALREDGKTIQTDSLRNPVRIKNDLAEKVAAWDIITRNPKTGELEKIGFTNEPDQKKLFETYVGQHAIQSGAAGQSELDVLNKNYKTLHGGGGQQQGGAQPTSNKSPQTFTSGEQNFTPVPKEDPKDTLAKQTFGFNDVVYSKVKDNFAHLAEFNTKYINNPTFRGSPEAAVEQGNITKLAINNIASAEFDSTPALQKQYTQKDVNDYNQSFLVKAKTNFDIIKDRLTFQDKDTLDWYGSKFAPYRVNSPKELYTKTRSEVLQKNIQKYLENIQKIQNIEQSAQARNKTSQEKLSNFVTGG